MVTFFKLPLCRLLKFCMLFDHQAVNVRHHKVGETDEPAMYRINDDLVKISTDFVQW